MPASIEVTRLVLRSVYANAVIANQTLTVALTAAALAAAPGVLAGKTVIEAGAMGVVTKYQLPVGASALQPQEVAAMWSRLLDLYDRAVAPTTNIPPGGGLTGGIGAGDLAILAWMLGQLTVVRAFSTDHSWSGIR